MATSIVMKTTAQAGRIIDMDPVDKIQEWALMQGRKKALAEVLEFFDAKIKEQQDYIRHHEHKNAHMDMSSAEAILEDRTDLKEEYQDWLTKQIDAT